MSAPVRRLDEVQQATAEIPGVEVRHLRRAGGAELKVIDVACDRSTPFHTHAHAHDAVVVAGTGAVQFEDGEHPLGPGDFVSVAANEPHAILGRGPGTLRFVCMDSLTG